MTQMTTAAPTRLRPAPERLLDAYIAVVAVAGALAAVYAIAASRLEPIPLLVCCAAAVAAERFKVAVTEQTPISLSLTLAVILAAVVAFGGGTAVLAALSARVAVAVGAPRPPLRKTAFNLGLYALLAGAAALVYEGLGGALGRHTLTPQDIAAALAAFLTALAVNWSLLVTVIHLSSGRSFQSIWSEDLRWMPVQEAMSAAIGFTLGVTYLLFGWIGPGMYLLPLVAVRESMRMYTSKVGAQMEELRQAHADTDLANQRLTATNEGLLKTLASVIDARDIYLYGHSVQASKYASQVAKMLHLPPHEVRLAELGALLHDLGKVGVSEAILNKPARLTDAEYEEIKSHCEIGYQLLISLPGFEDVADVVRSHHERYDGKGYPRGLAGEEIPMAARIISVVESVEAMVSDRPYRKGLNADEVLQELAGGAGTQWDPAVVEIFSSILSTDRKHLVMRNSALEVALSRLPIAQLVGPDAQAHDPALRGMAQTFQTAGQPIFVLDEELRVVSVNPAAERVTGWTNQQLEGRAWTELCTAEELRRGMLDAEFFAGTRQMTLRGADGRAVELDVSGSPLRTNSASYWLVLAHDVTERVRVESELKRRVGTDFVTGLANREGFEELVRDAMATTPRGLALALLDMDGFKAVNDTHGHAAGDAALRALADAMTAQLRDGDIGGRLGGDEFGVLVRNVDGDGEVHAVVARIAEALSHRHLPGDPGFSHGVAVWDGRESYATLAHRADQALYARKRARVGSR